MKQYSKVNQIAATPGKAPSWAFLVPSSTVHPSIYYPKKSDSLSQDRLYEINQKNKALIDDRLNSIEGRLSNLEKNMLVKLEIKTLKGYELKQPLEAILESDEGGFIARTVDLPLFGYGEDTIEAVDNLKHEVESLYSDLMEDDNFSEEWLRTKKILKDHF